MSIGAFAVLEGAIRGCSRARVRPSVLPRGSASFARSGSGDYRDERGGQAYRPAR